MIRFFTVILVTLTMTVQGMAQAPQRKPHPANNTNRNEQLVEALKLDKATAEQFTKIYAEYHEAMRQVRAQYRFEQPTRGEKKEGEERPTLSDEQIEKNILNRFAMSRAILDIREQYYPRFREVLTPRQIEQLYRLEQRQGERIQQRHHERSSDGRPMGRPGEQRGGFNRPPRNR